MGIDRRIGAHMARQNRTDTIADVAWRKAHAEALEVLLEERKARTVTIDNFDQELVWQRERLEELMKERGF